MTNCLDCAEDSYCELCAKLGCQDCFHAPGVPELCGLCEDCQFDAFSELGSELYD